MQDLPIRLEMVLEQVKYVRKDDRSGRIIDVGSDHGYLAIRCLEEDLADKYEVLSIPCVVAIKDGKELARSIGLKPKDEILKLLGD